MSWIALDPTLSLSCSLSLSLSLFLRLWRSLSTLHLSIFVYLFSSVRRPWKTWEEGGRRIEIERDGERRGEERAVGTEGGGRRGWKHHFIVNVSNVFIYSLVLGCVVLHGVLCCFAAVLCIMLCQSFALFLCFICCGLKTHCVYSLHSEKLWYVVLCLTVVLNLWVVMIMLCEVV